MSGARIRCRCGRFARRWWVWQAYAWSIDAPTFIPGAWTGTGQSEFPRAVVACRKHLWESRNV